MELTKRDDQMAKGVAIVAMLMLHLFCRTEKLPYEPLVWVGDIPLIYYLGLFGDLCVPAYCFCSGYAQSVLREKEGAAYGPNRIRRIEKFLVNFWVVLTLFSLVGIVFDKSGAVPGSLGKFLGNALLYRLSYNGAWWFVLTYLMLILLTPFFFKVRKMLPPLLLFLGSGAIYFASYVFRFAWVLRIDNSVLSWIWNQAILLGTSQFSFVIGLLFHRYAIITKLRERLCEKRGTVWLLILAPFAMFFLHCVEVSLIIAPITGLVTLICFHLFPKPEWICRLFSWLGSHSTNVWLCHMFFYLVLFEGLAYRGRYPLLVLLLLLALSIGTSYVVKALCWPIMRRLSRKEMPL